MKDFIIKVKKYFRGLTKTKKILWIMTAVELLAVVIIAITLPLVIASRSPKVPSPNADNFSQLTDTYVDIRWDAIKKAKSYSLEYYYGDKEADKVAVTNVMTNRYPIERQRYTLHYRVKAVFDNGDGAFCEWRSVDIIALKLNAPANVNFANTGVLSWAGVKYLKNNQLFNVSVYSLVYDFGYHATEWELDDETSCNLKSSLLKLLENYEEQDEWEDVVLTVKLRAMNYGKVLNSISTSGIYKYLYNAYDSSEESVNTFIITKDKYLSIKG